MLVTNANLNCYHCTWSQTKKAHLQNTEIFKPFLFFLSVRSTSRFKLSKQFLYLYRDLKLLQSQSLFLFDADSLFVCILLLITFCCCQVGAVLTGVKMFSCVVVMARQPSDTSSLSFAVPLGQ